MLILDALQISVVISNRIRGNERIYVFSRASDTMMHTCSALECYMTLDAYEPQNFRVRTHAPIFLFFGRFPWISMDLTS